MIDWTSYFLERFDVPQNTRQAALDGRCLFSRLSGQRHYFFALLSIDGFASTCHRWTYMVPGIIRQRSPHGRKFRFLMYLVFGVVSQQGTEEHAKSQRTGSAFISLQALWEMATVERGQARITGRRWVDCAGLMHIGDQVKGSCSLESDMSQCIGRCNE